MSIRCHAAWNGMYLEEAEQEEGEGLFEVAAVHEARRDQHRVPLKEVRVGEAGGIPARRDLHGLQDPTRSQLSNHSPRTEPKTAGKTRSADWLRGRELT